MLAIPTIILGVAVIFLGLAIIDTKTAMRENASVLATERAAFTEYKTRSVEFPLPCVENQRVDVTLWQVPEQLPDWKPGHPGRTSKRGDHHEFYCVNGKWVQDDKRND